MAAAHDAAAVVSATTDPAAVTMMVMTMPVAAVPMPMPPVVVTVPMPVTMSHLLHLARALGRDAAHGVAGCNGCGLRTARCERQ